MVSINTYHTLLKNITIKSRIDISMAKKAKGLYAKVVPRTYPFHKTSIGRNPKTKIKKSKA